MPKIQIYGKQELDRQIDPDKDLSVAFMLMRVKKAEKDYANEDFVYKCENLGEIIIKQQDKILEGGKDLWKQKMFKAMYAIYNEQNVSRDFEDWRQDFKNKILIYLSEIYEIIKNKN